MLPTILGYLKPRRVSSTLFEYDAQVCKIEHREGQAHTSILIIIDANKRGKRSVTNGIEAVLAQQVQDGHLKPGMLVIYRDTDAIWDQVLIDEDCLFIDFRYLHETRELDAVRRVMMMEHGNA